MRFRATGLLFLVFLILAGACQASQIAGHVYSALKAYQRAPKEVRDIIGPNLDAYLMGSSGPDIAYTTHYIRLGAAARIGIDVFPPGTEGHGDKPGVPPKSGDLIQTMYRLAEEHNNDRERAFVLGWLTHYCTDNVIHPLVNRFGGYYTEDPSHHKILEMIECEHVFQKEDAGPLNRYVLNPGMTYGKDSNTCPYLVNDAHVALFGDTTNGSAYKPFKRREELGEPNPDQLVLDTSGLLRPKGEVSPESIVVYQDYMPMFILNFGRNAENVQAASKAMMDVHNGLKPEWWGKTILGVALNGPPPNLYDYELLMEPLNIDKVSVSAQQRPDGTSTGWLRIDYTVNDIRLLKLFCDDWDKAMPVAIRDCVHNMILCVKGCGSYKPKNTNLNEGPNGFDPKSVWPGNPVVTRMLATVHLYDSGGSFVKLLMPNGKTPWNGYTTWIPIGLLDFPRDIKNGAGIQFSFEENLFRRTWWPAISNIRNWTLWGGPAVKATVAIPFESTSGGPYHGDIHFSFARTEDQAPYGIDAEWNEPIEQSEGPSECVPAGTLITMADGSRRAIENLKPRDCVLAFGADKGQIVGAEIDQVLIHRTGPYATSLLTTTDGQTLEVTANHPILTKGFAWKPISELRAGEVILTHDALSGAIIETTVAAIIRDHSRQGVVYNLKTTRGNYFANDVLVHNKCLSSGSLVDTPAGPRPVENVAVGDVVYGMTAAGRMPTQITNLYVKDTMLPSLPGKRLGPNIAVTANHRIWTAAGYQSAGELPHPDEAISGTVYDLQTETGNYYAGGILMTASEAGLNRAE